MIPSGRTYIIIDTANVTEAIVAKCLQTSLGTIRKSVKGVDRTILSWNGSTPSELSSYTQYTHDQIKAIVDDEAGDWYKDPEQV